MTTRAIHMKNPLHAIVLHVLLLGLALLLARPVLAETVYPTAPDNAKLDMGASIEQIVGQAPVVVSADDDDQSEILLAQEPKSVMAPDIDSPGPWLNGAPVTTASLKGKVVLIDFWTYSCVNCLRTLPHLKAWYSQYRAMGLEIIGVHAPEFEFEKEQANVEKAVKRFKIDWPVVMDSEHMLWKRFGVQYWPTHILVDKTGHIIDTHFGEGGYEETEQKIRAALGATADTPMVRVEGGNETFSHDQTPELYLGSAKRGKTFVTNDKVPNDKTQPFNFSFPADLPLNSWTLGGSWQTLSKNIVSRSDGAGLRLHFRSGKVFVVLGSEDGQPIAVDVLLNGAPINDRGGMDVQKNVLTVAETRLYEIASLGDVGEGTIELRAKRQGLEAYSFTFGK